MTATMTESHRLATGIDETCPHCGHYMDDHDIRGGWAECLKLGCSCEWDIGEFLG